jgi:hypothetical protein
MLIFRIVLASIIAALIAVLPYLVFGCSMLHSFAAEGGAPAQGVMAGLVIALIGMLMAMVFLFVARIMWRKKEMVVRQHLFGWPVGFAVLFLLLLAVPGWLEGLGTFLSVLATAIASGLAGTVGANLWLRLSYVDEKTANQLPEPSPQSGVAHL